MPGRKRPAGTQPTVKMGIARPTHAKVRDAADLMTKEKGYTITFTQMIDMMYETWLAARRNGTA